MRACSLYVVRSCTQTYESDKLSRMPNSSTTLSWTIGFFEKPCGSTNIGPAAMSTQRVSRSQCNQGGDAANRSFASKQNPKPMVRLTAQAAPATGKRVKYTPPTAGALNSRNGGDPEGPVDSIPAARPRLTDRAAPASVGRAPNSAGVNLPILYNPKTNSGPERKY